MLIHPDGGKGIGVESNGSNFPFVQPDPDIRGLLADLWLSHEYRWVVLPLRVARLTGFQQAFDDLPSAAQILIIDAKDEVVFDSTVADYHWKPWGTRLRIHQWTLGNTVCRVVQHCATAEPHPPWPDDVYPINGVLDERTSELLPERLLILRANDVDITGEIKFINGWNVDILTAPYREPLRNTTRMTFSAEAGGGAGRYPGCQDPDVLIRTIDGIPPDDHGNFTLAAGNCYYVRQPLDIGSDGLAVPIPSRLALGNDCDPCCDCDDFVNVQQAILNVEARLRTTAALAEETRDDFIDATDRWNEQKECREKQSVTVTAVSTGRLYADINVLVCNITPKCLVNVQINLITDTVPGGTWTVVPGTTYISQVGQTTMIPYELTGPFGKLVVAWIGSVNPQSSGRLRTRFVWDDRMPEGTMLTATAVVSIASDFSNPSYPQTGTTTVMMN